MTPEGKTNRGGGEKINRPDGDYCTSFAVNTITLARVDSPPAHPDAQTQGGERFYGFGRIRILEIHSWQSRQERNTTDFKWKCEN